ncbi:hypothetical protein DSECCO2_551200 [anaerobic digester metagenome]
MHRSLVKSAGIKAKVIRQDARANHQVSTAEVCIYDHGHHLRIPFIQCDCGKIAQIAPAIAPQSKHVLTGR